MKTGLSASFCLIYFLVCSSGAQTNIRHEKIKADLGQNVILPCKVPNNINIRAVEWRRSDLDPEYVLFYRDGYLVPHNQHPSYKNRVDLQDKEMKDGNFSMVLKNVMMDDTGTYECRVFEEGKLDPISIINLVIHLPRITGHVLENDGGEKDGGDNDGRTNDRVIVGSVVGLILLLAVASLGFLIYRQHMRQNSKLPGPTDEAAAEQMLQNKDMKVFPDQHQQQPQLV